MSSKLAQFLHQDRLKIATISLDIPEVRQSVDEILTLLFPQRSGNQQGSLENIEEKLTILKERFTSYFDCVSALSPNTLPPSSETCDLFFSSFPDIARVLDLDALAALQGDPAAYSKEEVILTYPGFYAICIHRLAHTLY